MRNFHFGPLSFAFADYVLDAKRQQRKLRSRITKKWRPIKFRRLTIESLECRAMLTTHSLAVTLYNADFNEDNSIDSVDLVS